MRGLAIAIVSALLLVTPAHAETLISSHGLSPFGDLKYAKGFSHFDYVNPDAPKGGTLALTTSLGTDTFNSFNPFILKGDIAEGFQLLDTDGGESLVFDCLMTRAGDEPGALYGLLAESVELAPDRSRAVFHLRKAARFHDGSPVTAGDVAFTVNSIKTKGNPSYRMILKDVTVKALDPLTVEFAFAGEAKRDLPLAVAELPIASAAYYKTHNFEETSLDPPLGSGPYKVGSFKQGSFITYDRVPDYWARDLPVNRGRWNFDHIHFEYYGDRDVGFQAFTAGTYDLREEMTSRIWATAYDFPAVRDGRVKRQTLPDETPSGMQGFFLNTRRPLLNDVNLRKALDLAFDFGWLNKNLFYGLYQRTFSYFQNSDMMAEGAPSPQELKLLEPFRDHLPTEVFGPAYMPPATDGSGDIRPNLRKARALLANAGYHVLDGKLVAPGGAPVRLEFLEFDGGMTRAIEPFIQALRQLGIDATIRLVDPAQYERLRKTFEFDITTTRYGMRMTPGLELRSYFSSAAANQDGSLNLPGIADPAVDALVEDAIGAGSRAEFLQGVPYHRLLGQVRAPRGQAPLRARHHRYVVDGAGAVERGGQIRRRISAQGVFRCEGITGRLSLPILDHEISLRVEVLRNVGRIVLCVAVEDDLIVLRRPALHSTGLGVLNVDHFALGGAEIAGRLDCLRQQGTVRLEAPPRVCGYQIGILAHGYGLRARDAGGCQ
jgi:microcin C transport system substrate-binding protein